MVKNLKSAMNSSTASLRKSSGQLSTPSGAAASAQGGKTNAITSQEIEKLMDPETVSLFMESLSADGQFESKTQFKPMDSHPQFVAEPLFRVSSSASSTEAVSGSPRLADKGKERAVPSLPISANATGQITPKCEGNGYLPIMSDIEREPLTALKEVRAELQKTFPGVQDSLPNSIAPGLAHSSSPKSRGFVAGPSTSKSEGQTLFDGFEAARKAESQNVEVAKLKEQLLKKESEVQKLCDFTNRLVLQQTHAANNKVESCSPELATWIERNRRAQAEYNAANIASANDFLKPRESMALNRRVSGNPGTSSAKPIAPPFAPSRALPFAVPSDIYNPESFAELNNRLKTGSRLSAIISTSLENRADFRAEWSKLNTALPRNVDARDFVKLATSSPTKAAQSPAFQSSPVWPSSSSVPVQSFNPTESLADFYNKRFDSLGVEAKELIIKTQKTLMPPVAPVKTTFMSPAAPAKNMFTLPAAPVKTTFMSPAAPAKNMFTLPAAPVKTTFMSPAAPAKNMFTLPAAPVKTTLMSPAAPAKNMFTSPAVPAKNMFMSPAVPIKKTFDPAEFATPFCKFLTENPTVFHAVDYFAKKLAKAGFEKLSERNLWTEKVKAGGKYFVERNGSSLIAFSVGKAYKSGNGVAMIAGHVDALTAKLKPVSAKNTKAGYVQLGVAPYAGALNQTWWDRDLGVGGRVLVKDEKTGKITSKLVKLGWPIARIPTLAPHFGVGMMGTNNAETQAVPIIGLDNTDLSSISKEDDAKWKASSLLGGEGTFAATQPPKLLKAIAGELGIQNYSSIINWELELFDTQPAQVGGIEKEFIFAGRVDDKLCSWSAMEALLVASESSSDDDGIVSLVGVFDDEEIGSLLRQGAKGNFLPSVIERITESFSSSGTSFNLLSQTYANSFLISADVTHAVNPNFLDKYLENHAPRLNVGVAVCADANGHTTTDSVSTAVMQRIAEKSDSVLQLFMIRNDSRSGGTVGPMLSSAMGVRAIDLGIPQLSMHSVRATTGSLDPGLGFKFFKGFFEGFEAVDGEFK